MKKLTMVVLAVVTIVGSTVVAPIAVDAGTRAVARRTMRREVSRTFSDSCDVPEALAASCDVVELSEACDAPKVREKRVRRVRKARGSSCDAVQVETLVDVEYGSTCDGQ